MPVIIPNYTNYIGNSLTKLNIKAPYSLQSDIDSSIELSGLSGALIENLEWGKAQGGTATLGGVSNGNGILEVKDASGNIICTINKDGVLVENGNIIVKNSSDVTVFDALGLVSTANFASSSVENSSQRDFNSGSYTDIPNTSITLPTFTRSTKVLVITNVQAYFYLFGSDTIENAITTLNVDGTDLLTGIFNQNINGIRMNTGSVFSFDSSKKTLSAAGILTFAAGSHTLKLRAAANTAASNLFRVTNTSVIYIVLGS